MNAKTFGLIALLGLGVFTLAGCGNTNPEEENAEIANPEEENAEIANPASVYCEEQGGTLDLQKSEEGSEFTFCMLPSGLICEEWAYFRGECGAEEATEEATEEEISEEEVVDENVAEVSEEEIAGEEVVDENVAEEVEVEAEAE